MNVFIWLSCLSVIMSTFIMWTTLENVQISQSNIMKISRNIFNFVLIESYRNEIFYKYYGLNKRPARLESILIVHVRNIMLHWTQIFKWQHCVFPRNLTVILLVVSKKKKNILVTNVFNISAKMRFLETVLKKCEILGISPTQSRLNRKSLMALTCYWVDNTLNCIFCIREANTFSEMANSIFITSGTTTISTCFTILVIKKTKIFDLINNAERIVEKGRIFFSSFWNIHPQTQNKSLKKEQIQFQNWIQHRSSCLNRLFSKLKSGAKWPTSS